MRRGPVVKFVTPNKNIAAMYPPVPAGKLLPDWWRTTPGFIPESQRRFPHLRLRRDCTVKACPGLYDYLTAGWILPLWADYIVEAHEQGFNWEAATNVSEVGSFVPAELGGAFPRRPGDHTYVLKIMTPWTVWASQGWSILVLPAHYHPDQPFTVMPGIVDSDRLPVMNAIAEWHAPIGRAELLKAGTPLLHLIPIRRAVLPALEVTSTSLQEWNESYGPGLGAVEGARIAAGTYREDARRVRGN